ncbi:MAG: peptidase U32 family protein, partial [Clostridia bacterium]
MEFLETIKNEETNKTLKAVPELLVPAGDFDCVRAGVQNGADCIYFGASSFSARASAKNFSLDELNEVIKYCKLRNVKTNLTLNTLITDSEFSDAIQVAEAAYKAGVDAIIVQDLGLAKYLIENFPGIEIHGSTQMSVHNLEGVLELQKLGFSRVVLSREIPINEIEYIRNNCSVDLEIFIHGALCISYSGQCLFSSLVGGRSGNRGKCAQPCRLPYELLECNG